MQPQGFPLCWGYPPPISAERGRSGKVCNSWPGMKPAQDLSSGSEAFSKKVLLPRSGALCAQKGLQTSCRSNVTWLRLCTGGQKEQTNTSTESTTCVEIYGMFIGFQGRDFHLNSIFNQFMYYIPCYATNCGRSRKIFLPCEITMAKNSYVRSMEMTSSVVNCWLCLW